jgi:hypothetical protein
MIVRYQPKEHGPFIKEWLDLRKISTHICEDLPAIGYVFIFMGRPIASAHLRMCEGTLGIIEALVSNPMERGDIRHVAIDEVVKGLLADATSMGMKTILAYSVDDSTLKRSVSHGFSRYPHVLIGKSLGV